jgi:hypothetical protein
VANGMDRREFAIRQYRELTPKRHLKFTRSAYNQLRVWLKDDVCAAAEAYILKPAFQQQAAWSIRSLAPGANTPERALVEAVDSALVEAAKQLQSLAKLAKIKNLVAATNPPTRHINRQVVECGSAAIRVLNQDFADVDELAIECSQVEAVANRFWDDLVSPLDYFGPYRAFRFNDPSEPQWGNFVPSLNRILHPVGDFVVRCMLERVETLTEMLSAYRSRISAAAGTTKGRHVEQSLHSERLAWDGLTRQSAALREACAHGPAAVLRDSCVILTQVYAAFHPVPKLDWLGLPDNIVAGGRTNLHGRCSSSRGPELFDRVAVSLDELAALYDSESPKQSAIDEAVATGGLVIETGTCTVYWKGRQIEPKKPWASQRRQFEIFCMLARRGRAEKEISAADIYEHTVSNSTLSTAVNRLRDLLLHERDLEPLIISGSKPGTYRLKLRRADVFLF